MLGSRPKCIRFRSGIATIVVILIILVVMGAGLTLATIYYHNKVLADLTGTTWRVVAHDFVSFSNSYSSPVTVTVGPAQDHITWDNKAVADVAFVGEAFRLSTVVYHLDNKPYTGGKAYTPPWWKWLFSDTCYKVNEYVMSHSVVFKGIVEKNAFLKVNIGDVTKVGIGIKNWIFIGYKNTVNGYIETKPPVSLYKVYADARAFFYTASKPPFSGCGSWSLDHTAKLSINGAPVLVAGS